MRKNIKTFNHLKPDSIKNQTLIIQYITVCLIILLAFFLGIKKLYSYDIGFHLAAGEWILENNKFMRSEVLTYTGEGQRHINLYWLYQLSVYYIFQLLQSPGLVVFNATLISFSFVLLIIRTRILGITSYYFIALLMLIGIQALSTEVRPHVISWVFLNSILIILELYNRRKIHRLYLLPAVMMVWINFHSLAILGLIVIAAYIAGHYLNTKNVDKLLLRFLFISVLACLLNPYFINGLLYPLQQFTIISEGLEKQYISELQSPFTFNYIKEDGIAFLLNPHFWLQSYALLSLIACYKLLKQKKYTPLLIIAGFLLIVHLAVKNYGYYFFATLPYMVDAFQVNKNNATYKRKAKAKQSIKIQYYITPKRISILISTIAIIIIWTSLTDGYSILTKQPYRFGTSFDKRHLPVDATTFLNNHGIHGKILNHLDFGGYLDHFYPRKTFIDGRLEAISEDMFKEYFRSRIQKDGIEHLINKYNPEVIIFPYLKATNWWVHLMRNPKWKTVYVDGIAVVYVHANKFPELPAVTENYLRKQIPEYQPQQISELIYQKKSSRFKSFLLGFFKKQNEAIEHENLSMYCFTVGFYNAALAYAAATLDQSTIDPTITYFNLYQYFEENGNHELARTCLKKSKKKT